MPLPDFGRIRVMMKKNTLLFFLVGLLVIFLGCLSAASAEASRTVTVPGGRLTRYAPDGTVLSREEVPLDGCTLDLQDDVILIRETDPDWIVGRPEAGTVLGLSSGCVVDSPFNDFSVERKVLIQETDNTLHLLYSDPSNGTALKVSSQLANEEDGHNLSGFVTDIRGESKSSETCIPFEETPIQLGQEARLELTGSIILHHDVKWSGVTLSLNKVSVEVNLTDIKVEIETKPKSPFPEIPIGHFALELIPGVMEIDLTPHFLVEVNATGSVSFRFNAEDGLKGKLLFGFIPHDFESIHVAPSVGFNRATIGGDLFAGFSWGPGIEVLEGVAEIACVSQAGVNVNGYLSFESKDPGVDWHACEDAKCAQGTVRGQFGPWKAELVVGGYPTELFKLRPAYYTDPFASFYHSFTFNDGSGRMLCPHKGYRLWVHVRDQDDKPLANASVSYPLPLEDQARFGKWANVTTDEKGDCRLYIPRSSPSSREPMEQGNVVRVTASVPDSANPGGVLEASSEIAEKGIDEASHLPDPSEITLRIDTRTYTVRFLDPGSVTASHMPAAIKYHPATAKGINIPDIIPEKSGNQFTGWNTMPDGSGTAYAPGAWIDPESDLDLYAQFRIINNTYVVIYNANGGTWAPHPQIEVFGHELLLSEEPALWTGMRFLGWSTKEDDFEPEYLPGGLLSNPDNKRLITLYAVWEYTPVTAIHIRFDLNGGTSNQRIADQWIRPGSALSVTEAIPWKEGYTFLGWALEPDAGAALFLPGRSYHFFEDTHLYAVWILSPPSEPVKISYDLNGAPEGAKPEAVWVEPGSWFNISELRPVWDLNHLFEGWSTDSQALQVDYYPGTMASFTENTTLYAVWILTPPAEPVRISYDLNGAPEGAKPEAVWIKPGTWFSISEICPVWDDNHLFEGWSTDSQAKKADYLPGSVASFTENTTLYAVWTLTPPAELVRISYDLNGAPEGAKPEDVRIKPGSLFSISEIRPVWDDSHIFEGWSTDSRAKKADYLPGGAASFADNTTLYAVWTTFFEISFDLNGGTMDGQTGVITRRYQEGQTITIPGPPAREGFRFQYWEGSRYNPGDRYTVTESHTLKAVWTKIVPVTGDSAAPGLWGLLVLSGLAGLAALLRLRKKA